ncbi:hypothetical protein [Shewanella sp.]|uniref:hypothetical protein n=1 Tax=Shewanella sp. TaxID=50422 RepID=UPI003D0B5911
MWSHFPQCTNKQIRAALQQTAEDLDTAGRDNYTGFGLVQAKAAADYLALNGCTAGGGNNTCKGKHCR